MFCVCSTPGNYIWPMFILSRFEKVYPIIDVPRKKITSQHTAHYTSLL